MAERRACGLASLGRSTVRYMPRRNGDQELRERLMALEQDLVPPFSVRLPAAARHA